LRERAARKHIWSRVSGYSSCAQRSSIVRVANAHDPHPVAGKQRPQLSSSRRHAAALNRKNETLTIIRVMEIDRIITMASQSVRIQFLAFERSLCAVGCDLPLLVIPYEQDDGFDLRVMRNGGKKRNLHPG